MLIYIAGDAFGYDNDAVYVVGSRLRLLLLVSQMSVNLSSLCEVQSRSGYADWSHVSVYPASCIRESVPPDQTDNDAYSGLREEALGILYTSYQSIRA